MTLSLVSFHGLIMIDGDFNAEAACSANAKNFALSNSRLDVIVAVRLNDIEVN